MNYIDLPPYAPTLMESTRAIGYSIEVAIADIIDNSIAAKASQVDIDFFPIGESYISILDDGFGMTREELIAAMQYGSRISIREATRLQMFPDSFVFCGSKDKQYQQVGNAVPPIMAKAIAKRLYKTLQKAEAEGDIVGG